MVRIIIAQPDFIFAYLPLYIARENQDFEILNCGNDDEAIRAVAEGRADISVGDPIVKGVDYEGVKSIGGFINKAFLWLITFSPFLKDIERKTIATYPEPSTAHYYAENLAEDHGLELLETPFNTELGPLMTQEADIGLVMEPNYTQALRNRATTLKTFLTERIAFTGFMGKENNEEFMEAVKKGIKTFNEDDEKTLEVARKYFPLPEEVLKECIERLRKANIHALSFTKEEINNALELKGEKKEDYKNVLASL